MYFTVNVFLMTIILLLFLIAKTVLKYKWDTLSVKYVGNLYIDNKYWAMFVK